VPVDRAALVGKPVPLAEVERLIPRRFSPTRDIPIVCDRLSELRDRRVVPAPFNSCDNPPISCSVSGFLVRGEKRDYVGFPVDGTEPLKGVVFLHELAHLALGHEQQMLSRSALVQTATPTLHRLGAGETIKEILGRTGSSFNHGTEREAEGFALEIMEQLTPGVYRPDPGLPLVLRGVRRVIADPFGSSRRRRRG
jgi:hypothetical protein